MMKKSLCQLRNLYKCYSHVSNRSLSVYEPVYLELLKPPYPVYETLNVQIKGYDYAILENYQRYVRKVANAMELEIATAWAAPPEKFKIQKFKPQSSVVESEYVLTLYHRTIQLLQVGAPSVPVLLRLTQAALPEGVSLSFAEHSDEDEENRYVPDRELNEMKKELDELGGPVKKRK
ncbi:39S ribosomal protein L48, mitochondrial [Pseudolycoriella hygida]|uniref:39S ribosomal protein L48, mitochondrial n=1 Tax=Pseudolycoriella hygida TaxID=35572 RepID=A0A9Q0RY98_9DIPT|nr:39S ribosomal protein L48, mitochondrial [Pseudolycoriella hygida]